MDITSNNLQVTANISDVISLFAFQNFINSIVPDLIYYLPEDCYFKTVVIHHVKDKGYSWECEYNKPISRRDGAAHSVTGIDNVFFKSEVKAKQDLVHHCRILFATKTNFLYFPNNKNKTTMNENQTGGNAYAGNANTATEELAQAPAMNEAVGVKGETTANTFAADTEFVNVTTETEVTEENNELLSGPTEAGTPSE